MEAEPGVVDGWGCGDIQDDISGSIFVLVRSNSSFCEYPHPGMEMLPGQPPVLLNAQKVDQKINNICILRSGFDKDRS